MAMTLTKWGAQHRSAAVSKRSVSGFRRSIGGPGTTTNVKGFGSWQDQRLTATHRCNYILQ